MKTTLRDSLKKAIIAACIALAMVFLAAVICLDAYFRDSRPASPQPELGRVHVTKLSKGTRVYLTQREHVVYTLLMPTGALFMVIGVGLNLRWKQFPGTNLSKRLN